MHKIVGMIFAAGLGTRLAPFTLTAPKALVPVGGTPMLERVIKRFISAGITDIVVNVHHFADKVIDFLKVNNNFGANIMISDERSRLLDTGGGLLKALPLFGDADAVLVHNADILTDVNFTDMIETHFRQRADVSLLVSDRKSSRVLIFDSRNLLIGWENLKTGEILPEKSREEILSGCFEQMAFGGVHIMSIKALELLPRYAKEEVFSIIPFYVNNCKKLKIYGYVPKYDYQWFDVGSPEKLNLAENSVGKLRN